MGALSAANAALTLSLTGSFICGLPGESKKSIKTTMKKLLRREIPLDLVTFYPLWIGKKSVVAWNSAFNLDFTKFGYREIDDDFSKTTMAVNWQSDIMSYREAIEMTIGFEQRFQKMDANKTTRLLWNEFHSISNYKKELFDRLNHF